MYVVDFNYPGGSCKARLNKAGRLSFVEPLPMLDVADALVGNLVGQQWRREALRECNDQWHVKMSHRYTAPLVRILFLHCFPQLVGATVRPQRAYGTQWVIESAFCTTDGFGVETSQVRLTYMRDWWRLYQARKIFVPYQRGTAFVLAQDEGRRVLAVPYLSAYGSTHIMQHYREGRWEE